MTISIVSPTASFSRRLQVYDIPALDRNHVLALFGENQAKSLINLNSSQPDGALLGTATFSNEGVKVAGNTNSLRFKGFRPPSGAACTQMILYRTGATLGNAGLLNLWGESQMENDAFGRRVIASAPNALPIYASIPGPTDAVANRGQEVNTEYLLSFTRAASGGTSVLRRHNADGTVAMASPVSPATTATLPYSSDVVLDVGRSLDATQRSVTIRSVGLWTGAMTEAEVVACAKFMYELGHAA